MLEKLEECPNCDMRGPRWIYDAQCCAACGYDGRPRAQPIPRTTWDVLLGLAEGAGHRRDPGESEFDFLGRLVGRG